ncbi:GntR family transcriptional regulator [Microterricola viridarii]|uniref:GntR family transcriptional regulator n=1 Tax=Microterricola viridarii TaxID=412690 RepID=A0A0Y0NJL5_9MICO|nr:GntR family transcriptional regulator [Microterricola viridarii]AMB59950.1 GntR family transcriptional regulator [Microterricola viridarii]
MRAGDRAYDTLRTEILDGVLRPGTVLAEVEQSTRLGVSRTPVREALTRLTADRLVTALSGRGLVVSEISPDNIVGLYELRQALEGQAAMLAARRRDDVAFRQLQRRLGSAPTLLEQGDEGLREYFALVDDIDQAIDEAVDNEYLVAALQSVRLHSSRIRRLASHDHDRLRQAAGEHLLIVEAILAGDASLASHATHVHLHKSLTNALASAESEATSTASSTL